MFKVVSVLLFFQVRAFSTCNNMLISVSKCRSSQIWGATFHTGRMAQRSWKTAARKERISPHKLSLLVIIKGLSGSSEQDQDDLYTKCITRCRHSLSLLLLELIQVCVFFLSSGLESLVIVLKLLPHLYTSTIAQILTIVNVLVKILRDSDKILTRSYQDFIRFIRDLWWDSSRLRSLTCNTK